MNTKIQIAAGAISLVALLTYTLVHTGALLAAYVNPALVGYIAAFGIELAIVSLSLRIGELRKSNQDPRFFVFVLVSVVVVSALANIAAGFEVFHGERMTLSNVQSLDALQAVIGLAATGLISLIVLALSEIVGTDVQVVVKAIEKQEKDARKAELDALTNASDLGLLDTANQVRVNNKQVAMDALLVHLERNPNATLGQAGQAIGRSKSTVGTYIRELQDAGRLDRNGKGWEVIQS